MPPTSVLVKLDFKNIFNSTRILSRTIAFYLLFSSSILRYHDIVIQSAEGVQQGDRLGPLRFCLVIHSLTLKLRSELKVFYLDDGSLGGTEEDVINDTELIENEASALGLVPQQQSVRDDLCCILRQCSALPCP